MRTWRKLVKKLQRKKKRQQVAQERDRKIEEEELKNLKDPSYKLWLEHQEDLEREQQLADEKERQENEEIWLRRELLAQKQFRREEEIRKAAEKVEEELKIQHENELKEREEALQRKRDEIRKKAEQAAKEFEDTIQLMHTYLEDSNMRTPKVLQGCVETRPGEKKCEFYGKTHCCRFGLSCQYNHSRPLLSKVIVIRNFFQHRLLDYKFQEEYKSAEEQIEVSEGDLKSDYAEFCADVWPELEQFGVIVNFRTVRNRLAHARGHVFVEYVDKRSALKAFINLQNRYYASKRLNVEFSHVSHWRTAVCGFSLARKCPKGAFCNYLHLIPNPNNKYNAPLEPIDRSQRGKSMQETPLLSWNHVTAGEGTPNRRSRNWRWSESPEVEISTNATNTQQPSGHSGGEKGRNISASEKADTIVISSSSPEHEEEAEKRKKKFTTARNTRRTPECLKRKHKSKWGHTQKDKSHWPSDNESVVLSSSSSDYEVDGEVRRKSRNSEETRSSGTDRRKEYSGSRRHKHDKRNMSEERYKTSSRKGSSHHRRRNHKYSDERR